jgi:hypothetical protein
MSTPYINKILLHPDEVRALKLCKKKKRLTCRDIDWFILASMVKKTVLDKIVPLRNGEPDWAFYRLSKRGARWLELQRRRQQA